jgi:hypothetical protein
VNNPDSIREFFRKTADGTLAKSNTDKLSVLHSSQKLLPRPSTSSNAQVETDFARGRDFGIGLPPLANC